MFSAVIPTTDIRQVDGGVFDGASPLHHQTPGERYFAVKASDGVMVLLT
jgi:hypothetical protein